ncbi:MAG: type II toxin-antitoxin system RelE/ParE family toxin [Chloroflexi bacterium]|nr:type II toxin-antitoxin system RelE/ParE family toxin [Chloroflexota bacterium]
MSYQLEVSSAAQREIQGLPGHVRQRVRRATRDLADNPRPAGSRRLDFDLATGEPRRVRLDRWRIVYAVIEADVKLVVVLAVRRRPPYDYSDLPELFDDLS